MSKPATVARPVVGARRPHSILMVVVLPAPLGPRNPKICPPSTCSDSSATASSVPKRRPRPSVRTTGAVSRPGATDTLTGGGSRGPRRSGGSSGLPSMRWLSGETRPPPAPLQGPPPRPGAPPRAPPPPPARGLRGAIGVSASASNASRRPSLAGAEAHPEETEAECHRHGAVRDQHADRQRDGVEPALAQDEVVQPAHRPRGEHHWRYAI